IHGWRLLLLLAVDLPAVPAANTATTCHYFVPPAPAAAPTTPLLLLLRSGRSHCYADTAAAAGHGDGKFTILAPALAPVPTLRPSNVALYPLICSEAFEVASTNRKCSDPVERPLASVNAKTHIRAQTRLRTSPTPGHQKKKAFEFSD